MNDPLMFRFLQRLGLTQADRVLAMKKKRARNTRPSLRNRKRRRRRREAVVKASRKRNR